MVNVQPNKRVVAEEQICCRPFLYLYAGRHPAARWDEFHIIRLAEREPVENDSDVTRWSRLSFSNTLRLWRTHTALWLQFLLKVRPFINKTNVNFCNTVVIHTETVQFAAVWSPRSLDLFYNLLPTVNWLWVSFFASFTPLLKVWS